MEWFRNVLSALRGTQLSLLISQVFDSSTDSPNSRLKTVSHAARPTSMQVCIGDSCANTPKEHIFSANPQKKRSITAGFRNADSDRSERHADASSQFRSEWTMRCELFMVCLEPAQRTKARLQETLNDYIKQRKENKAWPNKSHIHLHNIKCNCFTCFLSIVVSRPVFVASHRGVIQECLVCTARHPAFITD